MVANSYSNRAYNWGSLKGMEARGVREYRYEAVLDNRTSDICRELHGKVWSVSDGLAQSEAALYADEDDLEYVDPYVSYSDIQGQDLESLKNMGALIPPNHFFCRSIVVAI
jgi:uncharacterized protein with gpF-like domain